MEDTTDVEQPETRPTAAPLEPLVGPWYSREDCQNLVRQYLSCDELADVFWMKHLNAAFDKGRQIGGNETVARLDGVEVAMKELLTAVCKVQDWDGTRVGAAIEVAERLL